MDYLSWDVVQREGNPRFKEINQIVQEIIEDVGVKQSIKEFLANEEFVYAPPYLLMFPLID